MPSKEIIIDDDTRLRFTRDLLVAAANLGIGKINNQTFEGEISRALRDHIGVEATTDQLKEMRKLIQEEYPVKSVGLSHYAQKFVTVTRRAQGDYLQNFGEKLSKGRLSFTDAAIWIILTPAIMATQTIAVAQVLAERVIDQLDSFMQKFNFTLIGTSKTVTFRLPKGQKAAVGVLKLLETKEPTRTPDQEIGERYIRHQAQEEGFDGKKQLASPIPDAARDSAAQVGTPVRIDEEQPRRESQQKPVEKTIKFNSRGGRHANHVRELQARRAAVRSQRGTST